MSSAPPDRVTIADVRRSFNAKGGTDPWLLAHVFRPLAALVTPPFYNAGLSGNAVRARLAPAQKGERRALAVMINVSFVAPLVLLLPFGAEKFVLLLVVTQLPADLVVTALTLWQANIMLRRWRRSTHANP